MVRTGMYSRTAVSCRIWMSWFGRFYFQMWFDLSAINTHSKNSCPTPTVVNSPEWNFGIVCLITPLPLVRNWVQGLRFVENTTLPVPWYNISRALEYSLLGIVSDSQGLLGVGTCVLISFFLRQYRSQRLQVISYHLWVCAISSSNRSI